MGSIEKGVLVVLALLGTGACSDVTDQAPIAERQLAVTTVAASYVADRDVTIAESVGNLGTLTTCAAHATIPTGASQRSCLMHWPVPMMSVTVTSAYLDLRVTDASNQPANIYRLSKHFSETEATWTLARVIQPNFQLTWQVPGAKGTQDRSVSLGAPTFGQLGDAVYFLNAANGGLQMVQSWFSNPTENKGIIIELNSTDRLQFASREDATPEFRPTLYVEYEVN